MDVANNADLRLDKSDDLSLANSALVQGNVMHLSTLDSR
jgi:hypothetical protein